MTSKIKVDNIENQCGGAVVTKCGGTTTITGTVVKSNTLQAPDAGNIISQSGTTITLGASGDTINLASGASQSGFGRSGSVNWDTTPKTATFTGVSGNGYFINTTGGVVTVNLPSSPSAGNIVSIVDYAGTAASNNITIGRGGSNINGDASDITISKNDSGITLVYVDGTQGWKGTETSNLNDIELQPEYIAATGGTITCSGNFKIHTFTGPGTFCVSSLANPAGGSNSVDYLVIAGGGGGGTSGNPSSSHGGSGAGAGGYRFSNGTASGSYTTAPGPLAPLGVTALPVSVQGYPITVGGGGSGSPSPSCSSGSSGNPAVFSTITSTGGGGGGSRTPGGGSNGGSGGSGGGSNTLSCAGAGNTPPVSPPQGNNGGTGGNTGNPGGGGIGSVGVNTPNNNNGGNGGDGIASSITGTPVARGGGGGGSGIPTVGTGQAGGGNGAADGPGANGCAGTANTGGGGGGGSRHPNSSSGGQGGSGIVIIRYRAR